MSGTAVVVVTVPSSAPGDVLKYLVTGLVRRDTYCLFLLILVSVMPVGFVAGCVPILLSRYISTQKPQWQARQTLRVL